MQLSESKLSTCSLQTVNDTRRTFLFALLFIFSAGTWFFFYESLKGCTFKGCTNRPHWPVYVLASYRVPGGVHFMRARSLARSHVIRNMGGIFIAVEQLAQVASGANAFKMWVQPQAVCYLLISPSSLKTNKELPFLFTMMHISGKGGFLGYNKIEEQYTGREGNPPEQSN